MGTNRKFFAWTLTAAFALSGCSVDESARRATQEAKADPGLLLRTSLVATTRDVRLPVNASSTEATTAPYSLDEYGYIAAPWFGSGTPSDAPAFGSVQIADVTGDGLNDLAVVGYNISEDGFASFLVYQQKPDGSFALAYRASMPTIGDAGSATGDFNEDGVPDVVVAGYTQFATFLSAGDGGFHSSTQPIYDETGLQALQPPGVIDANGDGHLDLVFYLNRQYGAPATASTLPRITILFGDGLGGFAARTTTVTYGTDPYDSETPVSLSVGDLNGDGWRDLAVRVDQFDYGQQMTRQLVRRFLNDHSGRLVPASDIYARLTSGSSFMDHLAIGDFNGDGRADIAASSEGMDMHVGVLHQSASGQFDQPPLVKSSEPIGIAAIAADLDNNGAPDLLVAHQGWGRVTFYLQHSGALDDKQIRNFSGGGPYGESGMAVGDLDGDDCKDVAIAASYDGLRLMRGSNCRALPKVVAQVCHTQLPASSSAPLALGRAGRTRLVHPLGAIVGEIGEGPLR